MAEVGVVDPEVNDKRRAESGDRGEQQSPPDPGLPSAPAPGTQQYDRDRRGAERAADSRPVVRDEGDQMRVRGLQPRGVGSEELQVGGNEDAAQPDDRDDDAATQ